jgi:hypothetical protein
MGELITADLKNTDGSETVMQTWTQDLASTRASMFSGIRNGDKIMMAFAKARAMRQIISTTKNERLRAELLIVTDPEVAMVELAHNPTPEDRVRICAIACMTGFVPGSGEYGIFGGGQDRSGNAKPGKLFIKEAGYRTLFAQVGAVAHVEVDHPEYVAFGTSGKKVWRVAGRAYVDIADEHHEAVYQIGQNGIDFRLGIAGYESDIIAAVTAKARRQMLKQLWSMVSPMLTEDHADDDDILPQPEAAAITQQPSATQANSQDDSRLLAEAGFDGWHKRAQTRITNTEQLRAVNEYWEAIKAAKNKNELRVLHKDLTATQVKTLGKNNVDELCRFILFAQESVPESEG